MSEEIKTSHVHRLMTRLERMKENEIICDFTIKIENKSFPAHRTVLVASSDYFEGMFSSNMKEVREGFVEMKDLGINSFEQSLEFMYTGTAKITTESVQEILHVADLFQLDGLKNLCFQFLLDNLSPNNCLSVVNLAETYNRPDAKEKAEVIVASDFEAVIFSEMFSSISRSDLFRYISNVDYETSWKAAITWAQDKDDFHQLIEGMEIEKFPFKFLLETVWEEPLVKTSPEVKKLVLSAIFSDPDKMEENLELGNCISLKLLGTSRGVTDEFDDVIDRFVEEHFEEIATKEDFCFISKNNVIALFRCPNTTYFCETVKWNAALKWIQHDFENRKKVFAELFRTLKLQDISLTYLKDVVREETLVKESKKCCDLLLDFFISNAIEVERDMEQYHLLAGFIFRSRMNLYLDSTDAEEGAVGGVTEDKVLGKACQNWTVPFDLQPPSGEMHHEELPESLPGYEDYETIKITYSFRSGEIEGMPHPSQDFTAYFPSTSEVHSFILPSLEEAFGSGQTFKFEFYPDLSEGRITWGYIPHKTNKSGGRKK